MCAATKGGLSLADVDVTKEAVIQGRVLRGGNPVAGAYVRLLDSGGEFTAEVPTSATGHFRFFAVDGKWTLRTLVPGAKLDRSVVAARGRVRRSTSTSRLSDLSSLTCQISDQSGVLHSQQPLW
jgi:hypothetical protein